MDKDTQKKLSDYIRRRGYARGSLTRLEGAVAAIGADKMDLQDAYVNLEQLERCYRDFEDYDQRIADIDADSSEIVDFEKKFLKLKSKLRGIIHETNPLLTAVQKQLHETMSSFTTHQRELLDSIRETSMAAVQKEDVKLPPLDIPPFYGKRAEEFQSFKDLFEAIVDQNSVMSDCQKLGYLKGLMKGDAYTFVRHIAVTDANYKTTWAKVCKRYDQPIQVIQAFVKRFLDQPGMSNNVNNQTLRKVHDTATEVISGLKALGGDAESRDVWLNFILLSKLDDDTRRAWASKTVEVKYPTFESFLDFLEKRCSALENCDATVKRSSIYKPEVTTKAGPRISANHTMTMKPNIVEQPNSNVSPAISCKKCSQNHRLQDCEEYKAFDLNRRKEFVSSSGCCFNCLGAGHRSRVCRSSRRCQLCRKKHHTSLHSPDDINLTPLTASNDEPSAQSGGKTLSSQPGSSKTMPISNIIDEESKLHAYVSLFSTPLLPTARVIIHNKFGQSYIGRMLLDSGSNSSMISESCVHQLNLPRSNARYPVTGIASKSTTRGLTKIEISPHFQPELKLEMDVYIMSDLPSNLPCFNPELLDEWEGLKSKPLADPADSSNHNIDLVMGVGYFFKILSAGQLEGPNKLIAQNTLFGWIIGGGDTLMPELQSYNVNFDFNIDNTLQKFWHLEEALPNHDNTDQQEQQCEELFQESTHRDDQGRFIVKLPFLPNAQPLGDSLAQATSRFNGLERRLHINQSLKMEYIKFMEEYINLGHMEEITTKDFAIPSTHHFYLPHHPVVKETSISTKVRVVFDGSASSKSSVSLNKILMVGPTVQPDLTSIIMRFRLHKIAFTSDIEKMYRQVKVHPDHVNFQRILWRKSPIESLKHYKLTTVTYGTAPAAFLATRSLLQLAKDIEKTQPIISSIIANDFYVDDVLSGAQSTKDAIKLCQNLKQVLNSAGFTLHKWASNSKELLSAIETKNHITSIEMMKSNTQKVLGLQWNCEMDHFTFKVNMAHNDAHLTKRQFLSDASRLFDPLGWLAPMTITIKILFQQLWLHSIGWDDELPPEINNTWVNIKQEIKQVERIEIPRYTKFIKQYTEVHGFCDASKNAYAAAVYLRVCDQFGEVRIFLITAKTKVAPIRRITIPRLELLAAHLLAKLSRSVMQTLEITDITSYSWTDSEIVLHWLAKHPSSWPTYIANRTSQIHEWLPQTRWRHVDTKSNPCDCASRGLMPTQLLDHSIWWKGPDWLYHEPTAWPKQNIQPRIDSPESKMLTIHSHQAEVEIDLFTNLFNNISEYRTIKHILGFCVRFIRSTRTRRIRTRSRDSKITNTIIAPMLTCDELNAAEQYMWKWAQLSEFKQEIDLLKAGKSITKGSILSLSPFLDKQSILRVGGRLKNASCSAYLKHQVILPKSHRLCHAILTEMHKLYLHPTASSLFHLSRQKYWIINGKVLVKRITRLCRVCFKLKAKPKPQMMGDLPSIRVTPTRCFLKVGVDYAGPFQVSIKRGRGKTPVKAYVAVFICMATKAMHLEPVMDLSTPAFIASLRRFVSRRNAPSDIYSDNGTNFKGARNKLTELEQVLQDSKRNNQIAEYLNEQGTQWHFIPPASPSMGGLWEAGVKSMKHHLIRVAENTTLSFEEFSTLLCEIEAILNSRPLTPLSIDPNDEMPLTPAHFLLTGPLQSLPDENLNEVADNRLNRWQNIQKRGQGYWKRFSREYLHQLQQRRKWHQQQTNIKIGDLVYITDEASTPLNWPLGRVITLHPGKDEMVRVVTVKTRQAILKRPVTRLVKLPVEATEAMVTKVRHHFQRHVFSNLQYYGRDNPPEKVTSFRRKCRIRKTVLDI